MRPPGPPSPVQSRKSFFAASFAPSLQEAASVPARGTGRGGLPRTVQAPSTTTRVLTAVRGNPPAQVATWGSARPPQEPEGVATPCKDHTLRKGALCTDTAASNPASLHPVLDRSAAAWLVAPTMQALPTPFHPPQSAFPCTHIGLTAPLFKTLQWFLGERAHSHSQPRPTVFLRPLTPCSGVPPIPTAPALTCSSSSPRP